MGQMNDLENGDFISKIESFKRFSKEPGAILTEKLLKACGISMQIPYIHIAGTNGKGSTAAFLASILEHSGYRVGLFTSPHLVDFTERIQINGKKISRAYACELAERIYTDGKERGIDAGMFDYCTVMAIQYFTEQACDIAIMETGLGGKLDSTNAIGTPILTVITPIGLDHMQILGDTVEKIAAEKAGIIKKGTRVVLAKQVQEAETVLVKACEEQNASYQNMSNQKAFEVYQKMIAHIPLGLMGDYQTENAVTVLAAVDVLRSLGWKLPQEKVSVGLNEAHWAGRLEQVSQRPVILLDGAHNMHGVAALRRSLEKLYNGRKLHFLMGVMADKNYQEMVEEMLPLAERMDTVTPENSRALQGQELSALIRGFGVSSECFSDVQTAWQAMRKAPEEEIICVFGSLYFIGEIEAIIDIS